MSSPGDTATRDHLDPHALIESLNADPIAMLPVRLETRFVADATELRIRIFPEAVHVHAHVEAISPEERAAGMSYWHTRLGGSATIAWRTLLQLVRATRAAWIVRVLTPLNVDAALQGAPPEFPDPPLHDAPWTEPPRAVALPGHWIIAGYRSDERVLLTVGKPVPRELPLGPAPDPLADEEPITQDIPEDDQIDLPIDDGMRWLTDYDAAVEVGMAVTVPAGSVTGGLDGGFDRLLVVGSPRDDQLTIPGLLEAHRHSEGLAFVRQGTATNNTATVPSGFDSTEGELAESLDPARPAALVTPETAAARLAEAFGSGEALLTDLLHGDLREDANAAHMNTVLWETTWGYFLDNYLHPIIGDAGAALMREHFVRHVRGRGPFAALRVGDQPYGVLPAISVAHLAADEQIERVLGRQLVQLTGLWGHATTRSPFMTRVAEPADDLVDVLQTTPHSVSLRARTIIGPVMVANSRDLTGAAAAQEATTNWLAAIALDNRRIRGADLVARARTHILRMPFVTSEELSETEPLDPDYLTRLLELMRARGAFAAIQAEKSHNLLGLLARQAAQLELAKAAARLVTDHQARTGTIPRRPTKVAPLEPEFVNFGPSQTVSLIDYALRPYAPISGRRPMTDFLAARPLSELAGNTRTAQLAAFISSLEDLSELPTAELQRLIAETVDLCSHRVDAWHTSLATRRLDAIRSAGSNDLHLGGFGWVEDLHVETTPDSLGHVHAPSIGQATTAAILRSGHLAHRGGNEFALDLSSERVRLSLELMDGVRAGQPLAALLGYRFERGLREHDLELAQYILDFRKMAPLVTSVGPNDSGPLETLAARDVVDGRKLVKMWEEDSITVDIAPQHQAGVATVLEDLNATLDAVSDVLVAEAVHQIVHGNLDRGTAALDALDRQGPPPDPEFVRTPRSGVGVANRILVSLVDEPVANGWPSGGDLRADAEPRLNAWVARLFGDPTRFRFAAEVVEGSDEGVPVVVEMVESSLDRLGISPLSVVWAAAEGGADRVSELVERIAHDLTEQVATTNDGLELRILDGDRAIPGWPADTVGLASLHSLAEGIRTFVTSARPSRPTDFVDPNSSDDDAEDSAIDVAEHHTRANRAVAALQAASNALDDLAGEPEPDVALSMAALETAASFGVGGVLPDSEEGLGARLLDARRVLARRLADALDADDPADRITAVFGNGFVSLSMFVPPGAADLEAAFGDRPALLGGDELAATTWLQQSAQVRPPTARLSAVLTNAEVIGAGTGPTDLHVAQLPHEAGDRWLGLRLVDARLPAGNIGLVIHTPGSFDPSVAQAGLVADEWNEVIPNPVETTGISLHYDAPGTRAPQTILLAVPPDRRAVTWTLDQVLDTMHETLDLAKIRAVDPQRIWMVNGALPAIYVAANARSEAPTVNVFEAEALYRASVEGRPT